MLKLIALQTIGSKKLSASALASIKTSNNLTHSRLRISSSACKGKQWKLRWHEYRRRSATRDLRGRRRERARKTEVKNERREGSFQLRYTEGWLARTRQRIRHLYQGTVRREKRYRCWYRGRVIARISRTGRSSKVCKVKRATATELIKRCPKISYTMALTSNQNLHISHKNKIVCKEQASITCPWSTVREMSEWPRNSKWSTVVADTQTSRSMMF